MSTRRERYDLVLVGGGTGGLVAALIAAAVGAKTALIERERTGGDCLWTGCVPSKSLLAAADLAHRIRHANTVGLAPTEPDVDFARVMAHVRGVREQIAPQDSPERLRAAGVEVIEESATFLAPGRIRAGERELSFRRAIIATGSRPTMPPVTSLEQAKPLTNETLWDLDRLPRRLVVLGGGPIGCELGQAFARLGSQVTIVETAPRLLVKEEPDASELVAEHLRGDGVTLLLAATASAVRHHDGRGGAELLCRQDGTTTLVPFDRILVAAGRAPETDGLGLDRVDVQTGPGGSVVVDKMLQTTARGIYAVGDVTGALPFTHVAAYHARIAAVNALFPTRRKVVYDAIPWVTFTDPEVGRVGLTEQAARERWGDGTQVTSFDYAELDRAITTGQPYGFAKLIGDPKGRLVGATVAAPAGGEAIAELAAWVSRHESIDRVSQTVHAYPTLSEGPARAADAYLRTRLRTPRMRAIARAALAGSRAVDRFQ